MAMFTKKHGAVGWPNPQANQIEGWAKKFEIEADRHTAQTGTIYLTLTAKNGKTITVRCADHADAHCTATYTVDPSIDQRANVKTWIAANGDDSAARSATAFRREFKKLTALAGPDALMACGTVWYTWNPRTANGVDLNRVKHQIQHGYAADPLGEGWKGLE